MIIINGINYNSKNIVVGSLYLTTQDTSYISSTIIDGNQAGSVVTFTSGEDSTAVLSGFVITNGSSGLGGGIYINYESDPTIKNCIVTIKSIYSATKMSKMFVGILNTVPLILRVVEPSGSKIPGFLGG